MNDIELNDGERKLSDEERKYLQGLAVQVDTLFREELEVRGIRYDDSEVRICNIRSVGVQGDKRTYGHPAEITLFKDSNFVYNTDFLAELSTRITNEIDGINRVVIVLARKDEKK